MIPDIHIGEEEYNKLRPDYRGATKTGKRTLLFYLNGNPVILIDGESFKISK